LREFSSSLKSSLALGPSSPDYLDDRKEFYEVLKAQDEGFEIVREDEEDFEFGDIDWP
jgi:hypothetical protein